MDINLEEKFLDAEQIAEKLNISIATAYRLMSKKLPVLRFGKIVRVKESDLKHFIDENTTSM